MALFVIDVGRLPAIVSLQMTPGCCGHWRLGIDEEHVERPRVSLQGTLEDIEGLASSTTGDDLPTKTATLGESPQRFEELAEAPANLGFRRLVGTAAFGVDPDLVYQRFPPISPICQTSPSS